MPWWMKNAYPGHIVLPDYFFLTNVEMVLAEVFWVQIKIEWVDRRGQRLANGVNGCGDTDSTGSSILGDGGRLAFQDAGVNLRESLSPVLRLAFPH